MSTARRAVRELFLDPTPTVMVSYRRMPPDTSPYYTVDEVASILRVHPDTVKRWCKTGVLAHVRAGWQIRITQDAIDKFTEPKVAP